jgi:subtilisin family serine protease
VLVRLRQWACAVRRWTPAVLLSAVAVGLAASPLALGEAPNRPAARAPGPTVLTRNPATVRYAPGRLIVGLEEDASAAKVDRILGRANAKVKRSIGKIDARLLEVPSAAVEETMASLEASPAVEYVEREVLLEQTDTVPNDALWSGQWGPMLMRTPTVWDLTQGSADVVIAILDTGVDFGHPDLQGRFVAGYDVVNNDADPRDDQGHGTAVAGVIGARTQNQQGQAGVCWSCSLMPVKVLDASGSGTTSAVAAGIVWAADHGARVINMSLGGAGTTQTLANAVAYAAGKGVLLVAAAGNSGTTTPFYPAAYPEVVGVAGTTSSDQLYEWSNRGDWVQVAAPGCNTAPHSGGGYENFCGTSSATPLVAGIAGLALSLDPSATTGMLEQALKSGTLPLPPGAVVYGRVDALGVLAALQLTPPVNVTRPRIRGGPPQSGQPVRAGNGQWAGDPTSFAYQWRICNKYGKRCSSIGGATAETYVVRRADVGRRLRLVVRAANGNGVSRAVSKPTRIVKRGVNRVESQEALPGDSGTAVASAPAEPTADQGGQSPPCADCSPPAPTTAEGLGSIVTEAAETAMGFLGDPAP